MNRLDTDFGNDDLPPGANPHQGRLHAFSARHRFAGRTFGITIWSANMAEAQEHCRRHGLFYDGEITGVYPA